MFLLSVAKTNNHAHYGTIVSACCSSSHPTSCHG